jgi:hypothetical protein
MRTGVVYHKQLGDLVLLQPALAHLVRESGENVALFTRPEFQMLEPLFPGVRFHSKNPAERLDHLECLDDGSRSLKRAVRIRANRRGLLVPVPERRRWWHGFLFDRIQIVSPVGRYRAFYYLDAVGGKNPTCLPRLLPPPENWKPTPAPEAPYLLLHLTSGWRRKSWPSALWIDLIGALLASGHGLLALSAGTKEHELETTREVRGEFRDDPRVLCLAGQTSLAEYLWLLHHARAVVTVDGSASHFAAAWQRPCVTLFGPTDPREWHYGQATQKALSSPNPFSTERHAGEIPSLQVAEALESVLRTAP